MSSPRHDGGLPLTRVAVLEKDARAPRGWIAFQHRKHFKFSPEGLRRFAPARWEDVIFDAMVVCAAVEYADCVARRRSHRWARRLCVRVPVHDPARWRTPAVLSSLCSALGFLTGDVWDFSFYARTEQLTEPRRGYLDFSVPRNACMPYSSGLDSLAVSGIERNRLGERLVLVRVQRGSRFDYSGKTPFVRVPYSIAASKSRREASGRSRGFKFALISGLAAYLTNAPRVICPESGQGVLGPVLATVGHAYQDYRSHPLFTQRMELFLKALLGLDVRYSFPRLWTTKGETLAEFVRLPGSESWRDTKSCWRDARWSSVARSWRQCGVCAACMLRRLSVHAASLEESADEYICEDMRAESLEDGVAPGFSKLNERYREYAIAGTLHMRRMAEIAEETETMEGHAAVLAPALELEVAEVESRIRRLFEQHREEWVNYLASLGSRSFIQRWGTLH